LEKARIAKEEMSSKKMDRNETSTVGYCDLNCIHCYEEFLDGDGEIVGNFTMEWIVEYRRTLESSIYFGSFCKY